MALRMIDKNSGVKLVPSEQRWFDSAGVWAIKFLHGEVDTTRK